MKKTLFVVVVILLLVAFGVSAFLVGSYLMESKEQEEKYDALASIAAAERETTEAATEATTEAPTETTAPETTAPTEATEPKMIYEDIYAENQDTVGWITIPGTKVNYPVMQTPDDPNYYLERDFYHKYSKGGTLYAWSAADINAPSDNITIFGHNMANGSMFATLSNYTNKYYWEDNSLILFDTLYEYHTYKIYAVFTTSANIGEGYSYHQFVDADNEKEFNSFVSTVKSLSLYETGITPVYGDKLIALSTCEYTHDNGRLVVCAVRIT